MTNKQEPTALQLELVEAVRAHARRNYGKNGWDLVIECWTIQELAEVIGKAKTRRTAIRRVYAAIHPQYERELAARPF